MDRIIIRWAVNAVALWAAIQIVPGIGHNGDGWSLVLIALIFGLVNALVRPFLVLLTCPFIVLTLGLFVLILNAIMLSMTAWISGLFSLGFTVEGFWPAFWGGLVIAIVSGVMSVILPGKNERRSKKSKK
jgi:putative membrane protein